MNAVSQFSTRSRVIAALQFPSARLPRVPVTAGTILATIAAGTGFIVVTDTGATVNRYAMDSYYPAEPWYVREFGLPADHLRTEQEWADDSLDDLLADIEGMARLLSLACADSAADWGKEVIR